MGGWSPYPIGKAPMEVRLVAFDLDDTLAESKSLVDLDISGSAIDAAKEFGLVDLVRSFPALTKLNLYQTFSHIKMLRHFMTADWLLPGKHVRKFFIRDKAVTLTGNDAQWSV